VLACVIRQKPLWESASRQELADFITVQLTSQVADGLTAETQSRILKYLDHNLSMIDSSPGEAVLKMHQEYYRWAINDYCNRKEFPPERVKRLESQITDFFSKAETTLKKELAPDFHEQIDEIAKANRERLLRSLQDPLFPGLKRDIQSGKFDDFLKAFSTSWEEQKKLVSPFLDRLALLGQPAGSEMERRIIIDGIKVTFLGASVEIEYFRVTFDQLLEAARAAMLAERQQEFDKSSAEWIGAQGKGAREDDEPGKAQAELPSSNQQE